MGTRLDNRCHTDARGETTGCWPVSHRAFDSRPRDRLRSTVWRPAQRGYAPATRFRLWSVQRPSVPISTRKAKEVKLERRLPKAATLEHLRPRQEWPRALPDAAGQARYFMARGLCWLRHVVLNSRGYGACFEDLSYGVHGRIDLGVAVVEVRGEADSGVRPPVHEDVAGQQVTAYLLRFWHVD
jgi:hypothetical protein